MRVEVVRGADAHALLDDPAFAERWAALERACRWATLFQSRAFAGAWWSVYHERYEPVLVVGTTPGGDLAGLLPLALEHGTDALVAAGAHHAEYQGWLARDNGGEYVTRAIGELRASLGIRALSLTYLPPGTPLGWASADPEWARRCRVRTWMRPIVELGDGRAIEAELQRKKIRYWLRTLERSGPVAFERLADAEALNAVIDEIALACDLRQYVHNGVEPFGQDPLKRPFHLALMRAGLLHGTVLRAGGEFVSAQLNWRNGREVLLGLLAHSPMFARSSPGTLHMLLVARELARGAAREGTTVFDLSPGGEPGNYKERFATRADMVHSLTLLFEPMDQLRAGARRWLASTAWAALATARVRAALTGAPQLLRRLASAPAREAIARRLPGHAPARREVRLYGFDLTRLPPGCEGPAPTAPNALADLLAPVDAPDGALGPRPAFLAEALRRLERGERVATRVRDGRLVHLAWLGRAAEADAAAVGQRVALGSAAALLHDFYTAPGWRRRGLAAASLRQLLGEAARLPGTRTAYALVPADCRVGVHLVERAGFAHLGTLYELAGSGEATRWTDLPAEFHPPAAAADTPASEPALA